jgi:hypothetical protein
MGPYHSEMKDKGYESQPDFQRASTFKHAVFSRRVTLLYGKKLKSILPKNHFLITHCILVPIVVNKVTVALVGLANGVYTEQDAEILYELLPRTWTNVILESVKKSEKDQEEDTRLKKIATQLEKTKSMVSNVLNILKELDSSSDEESSNSEYDGLEEDVEANSSTKGQLLKKKLKRIIDFIEETYGGMCFIAPLRVDMNLNFIQDSSTSKFIN